MLPSKGIKPPTYDDLVYRIPPNLRKELLIDSDNYPDKLFYDSVMAETQFISNEDLGLNFKVKGKDENEDEDEDENKNIVVWLSMRSIGFPNLAVSNKCWVYNLKRQKWLKGTLARNGYIMISLAHKYGKIGNISLHHLVTFMFHHNDDIVNKNTVDHYNRQRDCNDAKNLRWASMQMQSENRIPGTPCGIPIYQIDIESNRVIKQWKNCTEIVEKLKDLDIKVHSIRKYCKNREPYLGFKWAYVQDYENKLEDWKKIIHPDPDFPLMFASAKAHTRHANKDGIPKGLIVMGSVTKGVEDKKQYRRISIKTDTKIFNMTYSHLIALAFIGPKPSPTHQIDHLNGDTLNDKPSNLEWVTQSENIQRAYKNGQVKNPGGYNQVVYILNEDFIKVDEFISVTVAADTLDVSFCRIGAACANPGMLMGGYYWCYKEDYIEGNIPEVVSLIDVLNNEGSQRGIAVIAHNPCNDEKIEFRTLLEASAYLTEKKIKHKNANIKLHCNSNIMYAEHYWTFKYDLDASLFRSAFQPETENIGVNESTGSINVNNIPFLRTKISSKARPVIIYNENHEKVRSFDSISAASVYLDERDIKHHSPDIPYFCTHSDQLYAEHYWEYGVEQPSILKKIKKEQNIPLNTVKSVKEINPNKIKKSAGISRGVSLYDSKREKIGNFTSMAKACKFLKDKGFHPDPHNAPYFCDIDKMYAGHYWKFITDPEEIENLFILTEKEKEKDTESDDTSLIISKCCNPVIIYDDFGEKVNNFRSIAKACKFLKKNNISHDRHRIPYYCEHPNEKYAGYYWRFLDIITNEPKDIQQVILEEETKIEFQPPIPNLQENNSIPVIMYNLHKEFVRKFDSMAEASRYLESIGSPGKHQTISKYCNKPNETYQGHYWVYASDVNTISPSLKITSNNSDFGTKSMSILGQNETSGRNESEILDDPKIEDTLDSNDKNIPSNSLAIEMRASLNGVLMRRFKSATIASEYLKVHKVSNKRHNISKACQTPDKPYVGYFWNFPTK